MESINIFGNKIEKGSCSCLTATIRSKRFDMFLHNNDIFLNKDIDKVADVSLTEADIIELINEAVSLDLKRVGKEQELSLKINTKDYEIFVKLKD